MAAEDFLLGLSGPRLSQHWDLTRRAELEVLSLRKTSLCTGAEEKFYSKGEMIVKFEMAESCRHRALEGGLWHLHSPSLQTCSWLSSCPSKMLCLCWMKLMLGCFNCLLFFVLVPFFFFFNAGSSLQPSTCSFHAHRTPLEVPSDLPF